MRTTPISFVLLASALLLAACERSAPPPAEATAPPAQIVVYSERREPLIEPIFERYQREKGVAVRFVTDTGAALIERLAAEGSRTPADLFLSVDAGTLWLAAERGLLRSVRSATLEAAVPAALRDPQGRWFGLSQRARTIVYARDRVDPARLSGLESLGDPAFRGRVCLRTSKKVYNQSLVAIAIERMGEAATEAMVRAWVANLAAPPFADDTQLILALAAGQCDLGLVNTYYLGRLHSEGRATEVWPFFPPEGTHVNISGAGITAHAPHPEAALAFLEWLVSPAVQADFAALNFEYPVREGVELAPVVERFGAFRPDPIHVEVAGRRQAEAVALMDRAGWR
jgi:iron(III) transport system substrate-binding protein